MLPRWVEVVATVFCTLLMLALPVMPRVVPANIWLISLLIWLLASRAMAEPLLMMPGLVLVTTAR